MILIVEDNVDVNNILKSTLNAAGYETDECFDGLEASKKIKTKQYDMILLDLMLPYKSGDVVLKEFRKYSEGPVIIISAKDTTSTKIDLLKLGADDYITKPFDLDEVIARVECNLRRMKKTNQKVRKTTYKELELLSEEKRVFLNGTELKLTATEYQLLELFIENPDKVYTKANIYELLWNEEYLGDDNAVKTHLSNLRTKLKKQSPDTEYIETVWGIGYRLKK